MSQEEEASPLKCGSICHRHFCFETTAASITVSSGRPVSSTRMLVNSVLWNLWLFLLAVGKIRSHLKRSLLKEHIRESPSHLTVSPASWWNKRKLKACRCNSNHFFNMKDGGSGIFSYTLRRVSAYMNKGRR